MVDLIDNVSNFYSSYFRRAEQNSMIGNSIPKFIEEVNLKIVEMNKTDDIDKIERLKEERRKNAIKSLILSSIVSTNNNNSITQNESYEQKDNKQANNKQFISNNLKRSQKAFARKLDRLAKAKCQSKDFSPYIQSPNETLTISSKINSLNVGRDMYRINNPDEDLDYQMKHRYDINEIFLNSEPTKREFKRKYVPKSYNFRKAPEYLQDTRTYYPNYNAINKKERFAKILPLPSFQGKIPKEKEPCYKLPMIAKYNKEAEKKKFMHRKGISFDKTISRDFSFLKRRALIHGC